MTTPLEESLSTEFRRAADRAPAPAPDLRARVETGYRRRRGRRLAVAAAVAVAAIAGGTSFALSPDPAERIATPVKVTKTSGPIEEVWPEALHTINAQLPNGRYFRPELFVDDHTVLVRETHPKSLQPRDIWSIDLRTNAAKRLVRVVPPAGHLILRTALVVGDGQVVWSSTGKGQTQIWAAPIAGGEQRKVASQAESSVRMDIADGHVVWSRLGRPGVFRAPLTGGEPELVPSTGKQWLVSWPWAGSPGPSARNASQHVVNLSTGEKRKAKGAAGYCYVTWCRTDERTTIRRRDGSQELKVPGEVLDFPPALDRFLTLQLTKGNKSTGQVLYDLETGKTGDLGYRVKGGMIQTARFTSGRNGLFSFHRKDKMVIVDLSVIASGS